jgi:hypothetical protein
VHTKANFAPLFIDSKRGLYPAPLAHTTSQHFRLA